LQKFAEEKKNQLTVFTIAVDGEREKRVRNIIKDNKVTLPVLLVFKENVIKNYGINAIPVTYLISAEGFMAGKILGQRDWSAPDAWSAVKEVFTVDRNHPFRIRFLSTSVRSLLGDLYRSEVILFPEASLPPCREAVSLQCCHLLSVRRGPAVPTGSRNTAHRMCQIILPKNPTPKTCFPSISDPQLVKLRIGSSRLRAVEILQNAPAFASADVREINDERVTVLGTLVQSIRMLFKISLSAGRPATEELIKSLDRIDQPGRLADLIATILHLAERPAGARNRTLWRD
jgi:hypothetical protein